MDKLVEIANETMAAHGKYSKWINNCRHFCDKYLEKTKEECGGISVNVKADVMTRYIDEYVPMLTDEESFDNLLGRTSTDTSYN